MSGDSKAFVDRLDAWREALGLGHNAFARHLKISHGYWHQLRTYEKSPSRELVREWITGAPEPWKSALHQAASADLAAPVPA